MRKQVIISRMLVISLMIISAIGASAQSSFRNAVKDYIASQSEYAVEKMQTTLSAQNDMFFESNVDLEQLTMKYLEEQYMDDMLDMMEPVFSGKVTEADLKKVISLMSTPEGKLLDEHSHQWSDKLKEDLGSAMVTPFTEALDGNEPKPIERNGNIPTEYALKFTEYMDNSGGAEEFVNIFNQTISALGLEMPDLFKKWMMNNVTNVAMNSAYGVITMDDLEYSSKLYADDSYRNLMKISSAVSSDVMTMGASIMTKYMAWMQEHGANLSETGEQALLFYLNHLESQSK